MPIKGQPTRTTNTPPRKNPIALILGFWKKNLHLLHKPITKANPATKKTLPTANSALSNKRIIPRERKNTQYPVNPIPIFWVSIKIMATMVRAVATERQGAQVMKQSQEKRSWEADQARAATSSRKMQPSLP